ncbi:MAG: ATP-binding cassette domain-containing protein [Clostridiaceae bacterium]
MLKMVNVSVTLEGDKGPVEVLKDISLTLEEKKIYGMTGPNGGGKSSIAKTIMGIYQPASGKIFLDGLNITHKGITERARLGIGYAFQRPPCFKGMTVRDLLNFAAGPDNPINLYDLLYDVGLCAQDYLDREINASFSVGELKRIEIASILARNLKIAVFDEPEAGIDLWSFQRLIETFENMNKKYSTTIVIISHQERILRLADQVILVAGGRIDEISSQGKILDEIKHLDFECQCRKNCIKRGGADAGRY